jgi:hypothetical protein
METIVHACSPNVRTAFIPTRRPLRVAMFQEPVIANPTRALSNYVLKFWGQIIRSIARAPSYYVLKSRGPVILNIARAPSN